ncbi:hypothetical protein H5410_028894 [Solanum commersonii]|uniref:Uncharacterized protein n=1 Tax=Solanum commersonii TaxID=4109 RepID=A0A9J5Z3Z5_SOLCO|nr:hypothetical protein H5410_028894 [Solanum commersonii]
MARGSVVSGFEWLLMNIINDFEIPAEANTCLRLSIGSRENIYSGDIKKLSLMLPTYLHDSEFFEHFERTDWSSLDAYKDKETGSLLEPKHHFLVEYVQDLFNKEATHCKF